MCDWGQARGKPRGGKVLRTPCLLSAHGRAPLLGHRPAGRGLRAARAGGDQRHQVRPVAGVAPSPQPALTAVLVGGPQPWWRGQCAPGCCALRTSGAMRHSLAGSAGSPGAVVPVLSASCTVCSVSPQRQLQGRPGRVLDAQRAQEAGVCVSGACHRSSASARGGACRQLPSHVSHPNWVDHLRPCTRSNGRTRCRTARRLLRRGRRSCC